MKEIQNCIKCNQPLFNDGQGHKCSDGFTPGLNRSLPVSNKFQDNTYERMMIGNNPIFLESGCKVFDDKGYLNNLRQVRDGVNQKIEQMEDTAESMRLQEIEQHG